MAVRVAALLGVVAFVIVTVGWRIGYGNAALLCVLSFAGAVIGSAVAAAIIAVLGAVL